MNQPLNYTVNDTTYYYDLKTSTWYTITESTPTPSGFGIDIANL